MVAAFDWLFVTPMLRRPMDRGEFISGDGLGSIDMSLRSDTVACYYMSEHIAFGPNDYQCDDGLQHEVQLSMGMKNV